MGKMDVILVLNNFMSYFTKIEPEGRKYFRFYE